MVHAVGKLEAGQQPDLKAPSAGFSLQGQELV